MANKKIKGITIQLEGDATPLEKALKDVDKASGKTSGELSKINRALKFDEGNQTLLAQKFEVLQEAIQHTSTRLDSLKQAQAEVDRMFAAGEIDASSYREFQREIEITEGKLKAFKNQADNMTAKVDIQADTSALDKAESKLKALGDKAKQAGKEIGDGIAAGAAAGAAALGGLAIAGQEAAGDLGRMNAVLANKGFDNSSGFFDDVLTSAVAVTGEMDSAVEAINNLANTKMDQGQLAKTMEHLTGAAIQFSDTLKLEGLADGLQETLATGKAIGSFGEYLERCGVDLEKFDAGLAQAAKSGKEIDYVLQYLSQAGAQSFLDTYKDMNSVMYENQKAQAELEIQTAKFSETVAPVTTSIMELVSGLIEWMNKNPELARTILVVSTAIAGIVGILAILGPAITGIISLAGALGVGIGAILTPIGWVVAAIGGLIAIVAVLKAAWEPLTKFFSWIWGSIVDAFESAWKAIKKGISGLASFFKAPLNGIIKLINKMIGGLNKIKLPDWVPGIGGKGINIPTIPMLAKGTDYFKGGMALVGEKGPELVEMPTGAKVHNNNDTMGMLSGNQEFTINIPVQLDGRIVAQATAKFTNRELFNITQRNKRGGR